MKKYTKQILSVFVLFFFTFNHLFSQVTIGNIEKPKEEKIILKPPVYDSLKNFEFQKDTLDYYQYIGLHLYITPICGDTTYMFKYEHTGDFQYFPYTLFPQNSSTPIQGSACGDNYYTIIDFLFLNTIQKQDWFRKKYEYSWNPYTVLILRNDKTKDTVYFCSGSTGESAPNLILVPYFIKQQLQYKGKEMTYAEGRWDLVNDWHINDLKTGKELHFSSPQDFLKMKWKCSDVTLLKCSQVGYCPGGFATYSLYCVLDNDLGNEIAVTPNSGWITKEAYNKNMHEKELQEQKLKQEQQAEEERDREQLINKFGQHNGELIAEGKVKIGMTPEMCRLAWGEPWDIEKTTTAAGTKEHWFYSWKYNLYFENGVLVKIEH